MGTCCTSDLTPPDRLLRNVDGRQPTWNGYIQVDDKEQESDGDNIDEVDEKIPQLTAINLSISMCDSRSNTKIKLKLCVGSIIDIYSSFQQKYVQGIIKEIKGDLLCIAYGKEQIKWLKKDSPHILEGHDQNNQTTENQHLQKQKESFSPSAPPPQCDEKVHYDSNHLSPVAFQPPPPSDPPPRDILRAHRMTPSTLCAPAKDENDYFVTFNSTKLGLALYPDKNGKNCIVGKCVNEFSKNNVQPNSAIIQINEEWVAGMKYDLIKEIIQKTIKRPPLRIKFRKKNDLNADKMEKNMKNETKQQIVERGKGILKIKIEDAAELKSYGSYCVIKMGPAMLSTRKVDAQEHPEWHETLSFKNFRPEMGKKVKISVYGAKIIKDKKVGSAELVIPTVFNKLHSDALELYTSSGKVAGVLTVKTIIQKTSNEPAKQITHAKNEKDPFELQFG